MSKYIIIDKTSNTGKEYIDENGQNCIEEQAAKYNSRAEAERVAQSLTKRQVERWEEWASIIAIDDRQYGIATQRNMYQPDIQGVGHATWITETENDYWSEPKLFDSAAKAQAYIDDELVGDEPYYCAHNEAGRPEYWVVDEDTIRTVMSCHDDNGNYSWPDDCAEWECCDGRGNVCGECRQCIDWTASQDERILRAGKVEAE